MTKIPSDLRKALKHIGKMTFEADITTNKEGLAIREDCFGGQLYAFFSFRMKGLKDDTFRIDIAKLSKILSLAKDDEAEIEFGDKVIVKIGGRKFILNKMMAKGFEESLFESLKQIDYRAKADISISDFRAKLKEAKMMTNLDCFDLFFGKKLMIATGDEKFAYEGELISNCSGSEGKSKYSIELLEKILDSECETALIELGNCENNREDHFFKLTFEEEGMGFWILLTPRVA